jgi:hypothetical protein
MKSALKLDSHSFSKWLNVFLVGMAIAVPALFILHFPAVSDSDLWWHMRSGEWILLHGWPHTDPFSRDVGGLPWAEYSWGFDVILFRLFVLFGLKGAVFYTLTLAVLISTYIYSMVRRYVASVGHAAVLTACVSFSIWHLYSPRPWLVSMLFFIVVLDALMVARETGKMRMLYLLPVVFAVWVNIHIQFVDGLILLAFAVLDALIGKAFTGVKMWARPGVLCGVVAACLLATHLNPYGWHIYKVAYDLASQPGVFYELAELQSMKFRDLADYGVLFFSVVGATMLFRQKRIDLFYLCLLAFGFMTSFRSRRDCWIIVVICAGIIAKHLPESKRTELQRYGAWVSACVVAVVASSLWGYWRITNARLQSDWMDANLPVAAVEQVQRLGLRGPLFNHYDWGGYLMWALRDPVSIDGRAGLYGDTRYFRNIGTWGAAPDWADDSLLQTSNLVIGPSRSALVQVLREDSQYKVVYADKLATVFVRRELRP